MTGHPLAPVFRETMLRACAHVPSGLTVLLSGGVDSQAVLRALLEAGKEPVALSFRLPGREPRDWVLARQACRNLGVPCTDLVLDPREDSLREYVNWAVEYGLRGKAQIECFWPRKAAIDYLESVGSPGFATGDGGDGYFGLSKKAMIHVRPGGAEAMDKFREWYFGRPDWSQTATIRRYASARLVPYVAEVTEAGGLVVPVEQARGTVDRTWYETRYRPLTVVMPLARPGLLAACAGWDWDGLNKPRQKQPIRDAFPEPFVERLPPHTNLQLGDSGIAEAFKVLTPRGMKSPVAYYNLAAKRLAPEYPPLSEERERERDQESLF
jgi:hypothetical protein